MNELTRSATPHRPRPLWAWAVGLWVLAWAPHTCAEDLRVVIATEQDRGVADKLEQLLQAPLTPFSVELRADADPNPACTSSARLELRLDGVHNSVRLVRCRDGTVLTRVLDPQAERQTPYLAAFVAAELIALEGQLEQVTVEQRPAPRPVAPVVASVPPPAPPPSAAEFRLRAGAALVAIGEPFNGALTPNLGVAILLDPQARGPRWLFELYVSAFGKGRVTQQDARIELTRNDAQLRAGLSYPTGRFSAAAFVFGRGSLTSAEYVSATRFSNAQLRWGLGVGVEVEAELAAWLLIYLGAGLDAATSRSDYRVNGVSWSRDPAVTLSGTTGLILRTAL